MSIFVKEDDTIVIDLHYMEDNDKITLFDAPTDKTTTLQVVFRRPNFAMSQRLISTSTVNDENGNPTLNLMMLQNNLPYFLAKSWNAKEPDIQDAEGNLIKGKSIPLNAESLGNLRVEIARGLVSKLIPLAGQII